MPLTTSAAAPRGPSLWWLVKQHNRAPQDAQREAQLQQRGAASAPAWGRTGAQPGPTFLLAPSGKALAGSAIWSCSFSASASLREAESQAHSTLLRGGGCVWEPASQEQMQRV